MGTRKDRDYSYLKTINITHGQRGTPTYNSWMCMKGRCHNQNFSGYEYWGGRGIKVCKRWMKFENFYKDMGNRPQGTTLGRLDNSKGYCKSNCRWETKSEQERNKKSNVFFEFRGERMCLTDWATKLSVKSNTLFKRYHMGWTIERILVTPVRTFRWKNKNIETKP